MKTKKLGSILSGIGLAVLLSLWLNYIYSFSYSRIVYMVIFIGIFGVMGYYKQKSTEIMAYAISIFIFLQMAWDYAVFDRGPVRMSLLWAASVLMLLNIFTGYYSIKKPLKILGKAIGIK